MESGPHGHLGQHVILTVSIFVGERVTIHTLLMVANTVVAMTLTPQIVLTECAEVSSYSFNCVAKYKNNADTNCSGQAQLVKEFQAM